MYLHSDEKSDAFQILMPYFLPVGCSRKLTHGLFKAVTLVVVWDSGVFHETMQQKSKMCSTLSF